MHTLASLRSVVTRLNSASPVLARLPPPIPTRPRPLQFLSHLQTPVLLPLLNHLNLPLPLLPVVLPVAASLNSCGPTRRSHPFAISLLRALCSACTHQFIPVPPRSIHLISYANWESTKSPYIGNCQGIDNVIFVATIHSPSNIPEIDLVVNNGYRILKFFNE
jgi:hypothetical protein